MKINRVVSLIFLLGLCYSGYCQYSWDYKDPNDLDFVDFGDNKVILYNGIGLGLTLWLDKDQNLDSQKLPSKTIGIQYFHEYDRDPLSEILKVSFRHRYRVRDFLYIGGEYNISYAGDIDVRTLGTGAELVFEWHLIRKPKFQLIYDNGVGPNYYLNPFPYGGTKFSFSTHYGLRVEFMAGDRWSYISVGNLHISNADISGKDRNPALDAVGISLGFLL